MDRLTDSKELALFAAQTAIENNALEPVLLQASDITSYTDFILVISGQSMRQVEALAEQVRLALKQHDRDPIGREGERGGHWVLLDYGDLVIHVLHHPAREYYDLEGLWSDATRVELQVPPELRVASLF
ncbi:MAG: ribosome silencing factor [Deltaproteobacteria bacterium]|nr:ribosome silencing factor [Deltaproteobacteria bacterium]